VADRGLPRRWYDRPVTVAAIILAASAESALADSAGVSRVRRIADAAWAGGAIPIIVVAADAEGRISAALAGAPVTLATPAPHDGGPVAQISRGIDVALGEIRGTDAALVWPARMCWAGPETATSLIEAHGVDREALLRPTWRGEAGWPVLLPVAALPAFRALSPTLMPDELIDALVTSGAVVQMLDLGDPGTVIDGGTARHELPAYDGPTPPLSAHAHEWGAAAAATPEDAPLAGPAIAPSHSA
jgi:CTP:molybdopterin cytidylyltransferase MocA